MVNRVFHRRCLEATKQTILDVGGIKKGKRKKLASISDPHN